VGELSLSVIVPAFNEARRLPASLPALACELAALAPQLGPYEVIIVDDGSADGTAEVARDLVELFPIARLIRLPWNCGKGTAVRAGVSAANGECVVFMDADLSTDVAHLPEMLLRLQNADVVVGSRCAPGARVAGRTPVRKLGGVAYNRLARRVTATHIRDTQCGFKGFRKAPAKLLFSLMHASGFGFDVEVITLAAAMGLRIVELPVRWNAADGGTVRLHRHAGGMLTDLLRARRHRARGRGRGLVRPTITTVIRLPDTPAAPVADIPLPSTVPLDSELRMAAGRQRQPTEKLR
jgi:glycosyltransferase involved in cell wall biosynthesis